MHVNNFSVPINGEFSEQEQWKHYIFIFFPIL